MVSQAFLFEGNRLKLNPSFPEIPLCLAGIHGFLCAEDLHIHFVLLQGI